MVTSVACSFESSPSDDDLEGAREARSERVLNSHVKQARGLELTCARLRADVDRLEPSVAGEGGDLGLRLIVVTGDEHVEGMAGDLALGQRACEGRVERLHEARTRGGRLDGALSADVAGDTFGSLRVFSDDRKVMAARQHAAADAAGRVARADQRDMHGASRLSVRVCFWRCRLSGGWTSS